MRMYECEREESRVGVSVLGCGQSGVGLLVGPSGALAGLPSGGPSGSGLPPRGARAPGRVFEDVFYLSLEDSAASSTFLGGNQEGPTIPVCNASSVGHAAEHCSNYIGPLASRVDEPT